MEISSRSLSPPLAWTVRRWIERHLTWDRTVAARGIDAAIDEGDLAELDVRVLRDIGASPRLLARSHARREQRREDRDALHLGAAAAAWRHW